MGIGMQGHRRVGLRLAAAAITVLCLAASGASPAAAQGRDSGDWIQQWLSGGRPQSTSHSSGASTTAEERAREAARLDAFLVNETTLLSHDTIMALDAAIEHHRRIVADGGWPAMPRHKGAWLRPGARDERVPLLRRRLAISGDFRGRRDDGWQFDDELEAALKRFQVRHGLRPNGVVDVATHNALNVPADERLATLQVNSLRIRTFYERVRDMPRYVIVNVPSFDLQAVRGGRVELYSKVIAGREAAQTPTVEAKIRGLNFFPYWHVPDSIARRDLIPAVMKDPEYLRREHIRALTDWKGEELDTTYIDWSMVDTEKVKFRQDPGDHNALGLVRIDMPNEHIVYLHDTPLKKLFGRSSRSFSAGCVRVERIIDLATWLVADDPTWNRARVDSILAGGIAEDVVLTEPVPVHFVYLTAWANGGGEAHFRPDLYRRDGTGEVVIAEYEDEPSEPRVQITP